MTMETARAAGLPRGDAADDQVAAFVGCFSRAAIYSLDEAAGVAKLDWQFEIGAGASGAFRQRPDDADR